MNQRQKLEMALGLFFCLIAIGIFAVSLDFPDSPGPLDSNTFPRILATLIFIFNGALIYKNLKGKGNQDESVVFETDKREYLYIIALIGLIIIYVYLVTSLGFSLTTILFMFVVMFMLGERRKSILLGFPVVFVLSLYFIFARLAMVPLPQGIIENLF